MQNLLKSKVNNPKQKTKNQIRLNNTPLRFNENSKIIETQSIKNSCINQYRKHNIFNKLSHLSQQDKRQVSTLIYTTVNVFQENLIGNYFLQIKSH